MAMMLRGRNSKRRGSMAISRGATIAMDPAIQGKGKGKRTGGGGAARCLLCLAWLPATHTEAGVVVPAPSLPPRSFVVVSAEHFHPHGETKSQFYPSQVGPITLPTRPPSQPLPTYLSLSYLPTCLPTALQPVWALFSLGTGSWRRPCEQYSSVRD
jgi:hypothetical protein